MLTTHLTNYCTPKDNPSVKTPVVIFPGYWTPRDCLWSPDYLFIYGDNTLGFGKVGQACIRDCPNAMGIPTKREPNNSAGAFYSDNHYQEHIRSIDQAIEQIKIKAKGYSQVVFPRDGLGTGLADLPRKAPRVYDYLCQRLQDEFGLKTDNLGRLWV